MCGGELKITPDSSICECEYCGSKQTIPTTDDEKRLKLYERANKLRSGCEFDKAAGVYESIVSEYQDEAEAYWGLVLCKYGIEYVDDPKTGKKIPTCHRSSYDGIFDDDNFELVMENSDTIAMDVYREEAKSIEELRKNILLVSSKEEPYDIFICYKETDDDGERTIDSVLAQNVYDLLIDKGYKVFFSRITLEDKLGREYEPYIFAALNSAKVMLAFGTSYKFYNAVWVKNEWSRFLQLMEQDQNKVLIPCYKGIDAYDMPKEFSVLQAQDMGKVGAIQDLLRGIDKIFGKDKKPEKIFDMSGILASDGNATSKRGYFSLEDGDWDKAIEYFDQALYKDAENASAHLGLFLAKRKCSNLDDFLNKYIERLDNVSENELVACEPDKERIQSIVKENVITNYYEMSDITPQFEFDLKFVSKLKGLEGLKREKGIFDDSDWKKAERFAKGEIEEKIKSTKERYFNELNKLIDEEKEHNNHEKERIEKDYEIFINNKEEEIKSQRLEAETQREKDYVSICEEFENAENEIDFEWLIEDFQKLSGYKDSEKIKAECEAKIKELQLLEKEKQEREKKNNVIMAFCALAAIALIIVLIYIFN